jgi:hypothetical protein
MSVNKKNFFLNFTFINTTHSNIHRRESQEQIAFQTRIEIKRAFKSEITKYSNFKNTMQASSRIKALV